jgi:indolepyruvate ferredoxin oxidoreductase
MRLFAVLARLKRLRESPFDPFSRSPERRLERAMRDDYLAAVTLLAGRISAETLDECIEVAKAPLEVRGFGHVKAGAAESLLERLQRVNSASIAST